MQLPQIRTRTQRHAAIAGGVVLLHVAALWALQSGLLRRAVEVIVPAEMISQAIAPPVPPAAPAPPVPPAPPPPAAPVPKTPASPLPPAPQPVAIADPTPAPAAPTGVIAPQPAPAPMAAAQSPSPATAAPAPAPAPAKVEEPVVDADYAANAALFAKPKLSERFGEFGRVTVRVTVGTNGLATRVELYKSSGFERLDNAALNGARQLRFRPAMRGGVPVEWTYLLPVNYPESK